MLAFRIGTLLARLLLHILPRPWADRIRLASSDLEIHVLQTGEIKTRPRMTLVEAVGATLLFDMALFGTDNWLIKSLIRLFTQLQNSWDRPFRDSTQAKAEIQEFCTKLDIQQTPWIWSKPITEYSSLNDFFTRCYHPKYAPSVGEAEIVAPACSTIHRYQNNAGLKRLLIKGCDYRIQDVGLPKDDLHRYEKNPVVIGYLSPSHYHRVHSPLSGKVVHCQLEDATALSASVKFWGGKFNLLNRNKRLVVVIEKETDDLSHNLPLRVALVVVGGVGVNTIVYNPNLLGTTISKGEEVATFRAGGSAFAMFSNYPLQYHSRLQELADQGATAEVMVGESLAWF